MAASTVESTDTIGAGDTFNAGVMAKLAELGQLRKPALGTLLRKTLEEAMSQGAKAGAVVVSRAGANPP